MDNRCVRCGAISRFAEQTYRPGNSWTRRGMLCPACQPLRMHGPPILFTGMAVLGSLVLLPLAGWRSALGLWVIYFSHWVLLALHEFMHAIPTWLLGGSVYGFTIGSGERGAIWRVARFRVVVRSNWNEGAECVCRIPGEAGPRWRAMLMVAAPILAHVAFAVVGFGAALDGSWAARHFHPFSIFYGMNLLMLLMCLNPRRSDAAMLWRMFRGERSDLSDDEYAYGVACWAGTVREQYIALNRLVGSGNEEYEAHLCAAAAHCGEHDVARRYSDALAEFWRSDAEDSDSESEERRLLLGPSPQDGFEELARAWVDARAGRCDASRALMEQQVDAAETELDRAFAEAGLAWLAAEEDPLGAVALIDRAFDGVPWDVRARTASIWLRLAQGRAAEVPELLRWFRVSKSPTPLFGLVWALRCATAAAPGRPETLDSPTSPPCRGFRLWVGSK